ncbi:MAG: hypothetical protein HPM95_12380 [Alphaproteobacteria bacterium]|nr:hypothetical protein [Alphaproteobacteria bacterium]
MAIGETEEPVLRDMTLQASRQRRRRQRPQCVSVRRSRVEATLSLANTSVLAGEGAGSVTATLNAPLASLRIEGMVGRRRAASCWNLCRVHQRPAGPDAALGYALIGDAAFGVAAISEQDPPSFSALELDAARVELDSNAGEGRLALSDGNLRPRLEGNAGFRAA